LVSQMNDASRPLFISREVFYERPDSAIYIISNKSEKFGYFSTL